MEPGKLLLLRHGESEWNRDNRYRLHSVMTVYACRCKLFCRFCGWVDVGLSARGEMEAVRAGEAIQAKQGLQVRKMICR